MDPDFPHVLNTIVKEKSHGCQCWRHVAGCCLTCSVEFGVQGCEAQGIRFNCFNNKTNFWAPQIITSCSNNMVGKNERLARPQKTNLLFRSKGRNRAQSRFRLSLSVTFSQQCENQLFPVAFHFLTPDGCQMGGGFGESLVLFQLMGVQPVTWM